MRKSCRVKVLTLIQLTNSKHLLLQFCGGILIVHKFAQVYSQKNTWTGCMLTLLDAGGTVGQEAVELICQNAWKTRQNETFSLWILLSPKPESFLMKVPRKMIFNHFFHFWPCQVPLWAVGAEKQPAERPPTEKPKVFQKYLRTWGEGRNDHIELGPSVCQWIQNINLIRLPEGPNWPTVPP